MVAPGFDPHAPPPPARSTYESVRLLGERRAELTRRIVAWLDARGGPPVVAPDRRDAPLIDRARASAIAQDALVELERDLTVPLAIWDGDPGVEPVTDHGDVWVVMWNSVEYLDGAPTSEPATGTHVRVSAPRAGDGQPLRGCTGPTTAWLTSGDRTARGDAGGGAGGGTVRRSWPTPR